MVKNIFEDILREFRKKYDFRIGSKPSSPLMEFSAGLALQYAKNLANAPLGERKPFYLSVPDKEHFTLNFSCTLLLHYLYEDYFNPPSRSFKVGDQVEIFGSIAQYIGMEKSATDDSLIKLLFAKENYTSLQAHFGSFLNRVKSKRSLSQSLGDRKAYQAEHDLNSLFNLVDPEAVNPEALYSQIYLITGRGNTVSTKERLKKETCLNQSLAEAFRLDTNLIVKPNLELLKSVFTQSANGDNSYFTELFTEDLADLNEIYGSDINLSKLIRQLTDHLDEQTFTPVFRRLFDRLADSIDEPYRSRLLSLTDQMPVEKTDLPDGLKLVVLDDIGLITDYGNTISGLLMKGIPVIVLTDRSELASGQDIPSDSLINSYRFCWNRHQISSLMEAESTDYCDSRFWQRCKQYVNQKIIVRQFENPAGDLLFSAFEANPVFARLDGFEDLKKAYFKHLRPAVYLLKNTPGNLLSVIQIIRDQVALFSQSFETVEPQLPSDLADILYHGLQTIRDYTENPKKLPDGLPVFIQQIEFPDGAKQRTASQILKNFRVSDLMKFEGDSLVFSGFPYRESNGKYLSDAVFHHNVSSITVLAWPDEAFRITNYLTRKLNAAGFSSNLPGWISKDIPDWQLSLNHEKPDDRDLITRQGNVTKPAISSAAGLPQSTVSFDEIQQKINNFRFTDLFGSSGESEEYLVPVDVIYFQSGSYMLLPHGRGGRVYVVRKQRKLTGEIDQASFGELSVGDLVVSFNMSREIIRHLSREQLTSAFDHLDVWRERLQNLLDQNSGQYNRLVSQLMGVKQTLGLSAGNPTRHNIMRWLQETDMLAPHNANLWTILRASGLPKKEANAVLGRIETAKRLIIRNSSQVSDKIKDKIITALQESKIQEDNLLLDIDGVPVAVQCGRISDREKRSDMEVPYTFTKRFIKD